MELLYVVCQLAAAEVCEEHRAALYGAGPLACVYSAPVELAQLVLPGWRVARWTCAGPQAEASREATPATATLEPAALIE